MNSLKDLTIQIHDRLIETSSGIGVNIKGIRYDACMDRAKDFIQMANIVAIEHPFFDGNKRTAYVLWRLFQWGPYEDVYKIIDLIIDLDREWLTILAQI